jgi:exodeoxyribonuclease VII large subunit
MDWFYRDEPAPATVSAPLSVSALSKIIAGLIEDTRLQDVRVQGDVTNYTHHARGHRYFSLSEKGGGNTAAVIRCVMWRSDAEHLAFTPEDGKAVIVTGSVRLYAPHGSYQLQVKEMQQAGIGE